MQRSAEGRAAGKARRSGGSSRSRPWAVLALLALACGGRSCAADGQAQAIVKDYPVVAARVADALLARQDAAGAIPDSPDGDTVNEDSNMEYALVGLAAAAWRTGDARYLRGLERGIRWLAAREEMKVPFWRGSFAYAYRAAPPYHPVPTSPGPGVRDARGVDSTSALFVYLVYLHTRLAGSNSLAQELAPQAQAALSFILTHNQAPDGFFNSSWQLVKQGRKWQWVLWRFQYAADQADVYLGLQAGWLLYGSRRYERAAAFLKRQVPTAFFDPQLGRYALGREASGARETGFDGFDGVFPQGYLPWVFGPDKENTAAFEWLSSRRLPDGSLSAFPEDPRYSLSVAVDALAATALAAPVPASSLDWLIAHTYDPDSGGIGDSAQDDEQSSNVSGFVITALLGFPAFPG